MEKKQFVELFTNNCLDPSKCDISAKDPPTVQEIAEMFEFLDEDKSGMVKASNLMELLEVTQRLKDSKFDHKTFTK